MVEKLQVPYKELEVEELEAKERKLEAKHSKLVHRPKQEELSHRKSFQRRKQSKA